MINTAFSWLGFNSLLANQIQLINFCCFIVTTERLINNAWFTGNMVDTEILEQMGLEKREAQTYVALVGLGSSLASTIARKTKINRSLTYEILEELIRKGFVSYVIRENRKYFSATKPTKLMDLLKERERRLREVIPQLVALQGIALRPGEERVEIYKGKEGLKTILEDILKAKQDFLNLGYTCVPSRILKHWYFHWDNRRVKSGIKRTALANPAATSLREASASADPTSPSRRAMGSVEGRKRTLRVAARWIETYQGFMSVSCSGGQPCFDGSMCTSPGWSGHASSAS